LPRLSRKKSPDLRGRCRKNKTRRQNPFDARSFACAIPSSICARDQIEPGEVVLDITPVTDRMNLREEIHELHVQAAELVEDEVVFSNASPSTIVSSCHLSIAAEVRCAGESWFRSNFREF
jgi:hypothetical protein